MREVTIPHLNNGDGAVSARMMRRPEMKIMRSRLPAGASIGLHAHMTGCEIDYVVSGVGTAVCDSVEEALSAGVCHYCPKGSVHAIQNDGSEDLVLITIVPEM